MDMPTGISLRDYFAAQALFVFRQMPRGPEPRQGDALAAVAYSVADAMLAKREKDGVLRDHEIEDLTRRAEVAERSLELFQTANDYIARVALTQLWEMLDVKDQTSAVQRVNELLDGVRMCLDAERERAKKLKPGAPATTYTAERIAVLERLVA